MLPNIFLLILSLQFQSQLPEMFPYTTLILPQCLSPKVLVFLQTLILTFSFTPPSIFILPPITLLPSYPESPILPPTCPQTDSCPCQCSDHTFLHHSPFVHFTPHLKLQLCLFFIPIKQFPLPEISPAAKEGVGA